MIGLRAFVNRWVDSQLHQFAVEHGVELPDPEGLDRHIETLCASDSPPPGHPADFHNDYGGTA